tara:strand:+ start:203 stop:334 length:132 start_codon:yes stop_codon:yes gene_type:complete
MVRKRSPVRFRLWAQLYLYFFKKIKIKDKTTATITSSSGDACG